MRRTCPLSWPATLQALGAQEYICRLVSLSTEASMRARGKGRAGGKSLQIFHMVIPSLPFLNLDSCAWRNKVIGRDGHALLHARFCGHQASQTLQHTFEPMQPALHPMFEHKPCLFCRCRVACHAVERACMHGRMADTCHAFHFAQNEQSTYVHSFLACTYAP